MVSGAGGFLTELTAINQPEMSNAASSDLDFAERLSGTKYIVDVVRFWAATTRSEGKNRHKHGNSNSHFALTSIDLYSPSGGAY